MSLLLVIDDEESVRYSFEYVFGDDEIEVIGAATAAEGLELAQERCPDVIVLDLQLPDRTGLEVFADLKKQDPKRPVIFVTAHGTTESAIEAMKQGAFDYLVKPVDLEKLTQILGRAFEAARLMQVPAFLPVQESGDRIVGRSPAMQEMCKTIGRVAPQHVNVLILGESGTGKELVARAVYHHSRRADMPFLAINCAAIPEALLESELFGHEQGAFTGANRRRIGKFEQCNQGTLFLDEIGDMQPSLQAKMLRVLQDQQFERLGGNETLQTNVRILAATNQDLEKMVNEGRFRRDLYYRLKGVTISVPPLRERQDDVAELAHYFLFRFNRELSMDLRGIAPETLAVLQDHSWPGNVRELQSLIREAMLRSTGHILVPEFLPDDFRPQHSPTAAAGSARSDDLNALLARLVEAREESIHARAVEAMERILFPLVLQTTDNNQTRAAELLGISRGTFRQKLKHLGLALDRVLADEGEGDEIRSGSVKN